jgi:hypothetical protein
MRALAEKSNICLTMIAGTHESCAITKDARAFNVLQDRCLGFNYS